MMAAPFPVPPKKKSIPNFLLVWVDANMNQENPETNRIIQTLKAIVHNVRLVKSPAECLRALNEFESELAFIVCSGSFGQELVPQIHEMSRINGIYIFCSNKEFHDQWAKNWKRVVGVYTTIDPICVALKQAVRQYNQDSISMSFLDFGSK